MKLSQYAKQQGISYRTALRWWLAGLIKGYQAPTGTIIVTEEPPREAHTPSRVAIYARVSSLKDPTITQIVVEHKDRLTRFGFRYLETLLELQGRAIEVGKLDENHREDLLADLVSIVYSFATRLYGPRRAKRKTEAFVKQLKAEEDTENP